MAHIDLMYHNIHTFRAARAFARYSQSFEHHATIVFMIVLGRVRTGRTNQVTAGAQTPNITTATWNPFSFTDGNLKGRWNDANSYFQCVLMQKYTSTESVDPWVCWILHFALNIIVIHSALSWLCTGSGAEMSFLPLTTSRHPKLSSVCASVWLITVVLHWPDKQTKLGLWKTPSESSAPLERQIVVQSRSFSVPRTSKNYLAGQLSGCFRVREPIKPITVDTHKALSDICVKAAFRERGVVFKSILQNDSILFCCWFLKQLCVPIR